MLEASVKSGIIVIARTLIFARNCTKELHGRQQGEGTDAATS